MIDMPLLTRSLSSSGRLAAALALVVLLTPAVALWASGGPTLAQNVPSLGVDMAPGNNTADFVGAVQTCSEAQVGDQIAVDVFVRDVQSLAAWELRIAFDHKILALDGGGPDYGFFLLSTSPSGSIFPSLFDLETPDRYFLAAAEFRGTPDSGSGVLTRLQFTVVGEGRSPLAISSDPTYLRPRLTDGSGRTLADIDGDGLWDSGITGGEVAVGGPCSAPSQPPPPTPPPDATGEPGPNPGSGTGGDPATDATGTSINEGSTSSAALVLAVPALFLLSDTAPSGSDPSGSEGGSAASNVEGSSAASNSEGSSAGSDGEGGSAASAGEDALSANHGEDSVRVSNGESEEGVLGSGPDGNQPDAEDAEGGTESAEGRSAAGGNGSSGWSWWLIGAIIAAALVVGTGGSLLLHTLRTR